MHHNLRQAVRALFRQKLFLFINVLGLTIGLLSCILIFLFVRYEAGFDSDQSNHRSIYRLLVKGNNDENRMAIHPGILRQYVAEKPEIKGIACVATGFTELMIECPSKTLIERNALFADQGFLEVFDVKFVAGNLGSALVDPHSVVLTRRGADRYFPGEQSLGKTLQLNGQYDLLVTGVMEDFGPQSHLKFDMLIQANAMEAIMQGVFTRWSISSFQYYFLLAANTNVGHLTEQFDRIRALYGSTATTTTPEAFKYYLQPLSDVYLNSADVQWDNIQKGDIRVTSILAAIGFLILVLATFNYMSLATVIAGDRINQIGLKKSLGATSFHLANGFIIESSLIILFSFSLALLVARLFLPGINEWSGRILTLAELSPLNISGFTFSVLLIAVLTIVGAYPGIHLARVGAYNATRTHFLTKKFRGQKVVRYSLIGAQLAICVVLLVFTIVIQGQLLIMLKENLGFSVDRLLLVKNPLDREMDKRYAAFRDEILKLPGVEAVTCAFNSPGGNRINNSGQIRIWQLPDETGIKSAMISVGPEFVSVVDARMISGRSFAIDGSDKRFSIILNRSAVRALEKTAESILGEEIFVQVGRETNMPRKVIGVVDDIQFYSLKESIQPMTFSTDDYSSGEILVKLAAGADQLAVVKSMSETWSKQVPKWPFDYSYVDDILHRNYQSEIRTGEFILVFTFIAVALSALGIFGLAGYLIHQKTKEIAIRLVLGASFTNVLVLVGKKFATAFSIAFIMAVPISYYLTTSWLDNYAYRTNVGLVPFLMAFSLTATIIIIVVLFQVLRYVSSPIVERLQEST